MNKDCCGFIYDEEQFGEEVTRVFQEQTKKNTTYLGRTTPKEELKRLITLLENSIDELDHFNLPKAVACIVEVQDSLLQDLEEFIKRGQ